MALGLQLTEVISESMQHIMEPVATQVLNHIIEELHQEELFKDNIELWSDFRTTSKTLDKDKNQKLRPNRVRAMLTPNINPASLKWEGQHTAQALTAANANSENPSGSRVAQRQPWMDGAFGRRYCQVFQDPVFDISLEELIVGSALSMQVTMEFDDQVTATEVLSRLYMYFTNGQMMKYVDIQYDYPLPQQIGTVMNHLWSLRGRLPDEDEKMTSPYAWAHIYSDGAITQLVNRNKPSIREVVVNKNNFQAWMEIECNQESPEKLEPAGAKFTFTVNVQYARVNGVTLHYPVAVNQQFVNFKLVPMPPSYRQAGSSPIIWQNKAVAAMWNEKYGKNGIWNAQHFPWWDKWFLPEDSIIFRQNYTPIWIGGFTINKPDDPNETTVFDLHDLPGIKLHDKILECIAENKQSCLGLDHFVNIAVFADDYQVEPRKIGNRPRLLDLSDGRHLIIRSRRRTPIYRVVISLNLSKLNTSSRTYSLGYVREETINPVTGEVTINPITTSE